MLDFLLDARQFVLRFQSVLIDAPLQIYCSALVFAPRRSLVRRTFADQVRQEVDMLSKREKDWDTLGRSLTPYYDPVTAVAFSPDGHLVASGAQDHRVQLWEVAKGKWRRTLGSHSDYVAAVAFSPDGQLVTSGADDSMIQVCEVATGICRNTLYASDWVGAVTFSPDGQLIASGSDDNTVQVWELVTGMCCSTLEGHSGRVTAVAFSSDGQLIVSGSEDQTAQVWDVVTGKCRSTVDTHSKVTAVALSPDGQLIVSASKDQTAQVWDAVTGTCRSTVATHSALVTTVALSSDSQILHTNIGDFQVSSFSPIPSPSGQRKQSPNILVQGQWVLRNQERFLWLPSENSIWAVAVREDIVCLGLQSGRVVLLRIH
jgi:WD40 repeat protein